MKKLMGFLILGMVFAGLQAQADSGFDGVIRIEVGKSKDYSDRELRERVYQLERAVRQLQDRIFTLELKGDRPTAIAFTCFIKTSFDGTFTATELTETGAKAKVMKKCSDTLGFKTGFSCDEDKVKCGQ